MSSSSYSLAARNGAKRRVGGIPRRSSTSSRRQVKAGANVLQHDLLGDLIEANRATWRHKREARFDHAAQLLASATHDGSIPDVEPVVACDWPMKSRTVRTVLPSAHRSPRPSC